MTKQLNDASTPSLFVSNLIPSLEPSTKSETKLYPLAQFMLQAGGMIPQNGFYITTHNDPLNKFVFPFGPDQKLSAVLDVAAWYNDVGGKLAFGSKVEVKSTRTGFNFAQFCGQLLLQSLHELQAGHRAREANDFVETCGFSICGYRFRLATLHCPINYLHPLLEGEVDREYKPNLKLSRSYNLLAKEDRAWAMGAIYGRTQCFVAPPAEVQLLTGL